MKRLFRHRPILILIAAMVAPPILYVFTLQQVEAFFSDRVQIEVEQRAIGDARPLFSGSIPLEENLTRNIDRYLEEDFWLRHGVTVQVTVATRTGRLLYPRPYEEVDREVTAPDVRAVAAENWDLMNDGLVFTTTVQLRQMRFLTNLVLAVYLTLGVLLVLLSYRAYTERVKTREKEATDRIEKLSEISTSLAARLKSLDAEREALGLEMERVRSDLLKEKASALKNEDEMLEEIERLEELLKENTRMQEAQRAELEAEKARIEAFEKDLEREAQKRLKESESAAKRFNALYKNLTVSSRAVEGFVALPEEQRIKAEEVIHQLNDDPSFVTVKRKVFSGKKNRDTVMEVDFAYSGRLYFRYTGEKGVEVVAIGNKNTQARDMAFLKSI